MRDCCQYAALRQYSVNRCLENTLMTTYSFVSTRRECSVLSSSHHGLDQVKSTRDRVQHYVHSNLEIGQGMLNTCPFFDVAIAKPSSTMLVHSAIKLDMEVVPVNIRSSIISISMSCLFCTSTYSRQYHDSSSFTTCSVGFVNSHANTLEHGRSSVHKSLTCLV